jgi:hypothetical protein
MSFDYEKFHKRISTGVYDLRGEVGVLSYPFSKRLVKHWRFATPEKAKESAEWLYQRFLKELESKRSWRERFIRSDLCRKFLLMGYTRSMRYYNHPSGRKWMKGAKTGQWEIIALENADANSEVSKKRALKLKSAKIFRKWCKTAWTNKSYQELRVRFKQERQK